MNSVRGEHEASCGGMQLPMDWPGDGPIDLARHDLPHRSSTTEWWYLNAHVKANDGHDYSLFAAFFALAIGQNEETAEAGRTMSEPSRGYRYAYSVEWALVDPATQRYLYDSVLDRSAPEVGLRRIDRGELAHDPRFNEAMREIFEKGAVPLPDRLFERDPQVAWDRLALDFDGNRLQKLADGRYELVLARVDGSVGCALTFEPRKSVVRHGQDGVVRGSSAEHMFYYFTPACEVLGTVTLDGGTQQVEGRGWYDHEFGKQFGAQAAGSEGEPEQGPTGRTTGDVAWNWVSAQLDHGWELSLYNLFDAKSGERLPESGVIVIAPDGQAERIDQFELVETAQWTSTRTFNSYPVAFRLTVPALALELELVAEFPAQEFMTIIAPPAFWEGRIRLTGKHGGRAVSGLGFVERSGFSGVDDIDGFFGAVGRETRRAIRALLPDQLEASDAERLIAAPEREHWKDGVDLAQYERALLSPILEIVERGGKTWRSYGLLACIDVVGGDSEPFRDWLALPELLHVGSLIVDDVQDGSSVRRGGPAAHVGHGLPLAINAGTACYFLAEIPLSRAKVPPERALAVYHRFFEALRAAHAGQALDISGLNELMPQVVDSGDGDLLERRLRATHRLKSAVPPSALARAAVVLGGGSKEQELALADLFEAYGVAFQIIDDVLNLRGFRGDLKTRGEDVTEGKVTAPIAKAMSLLPRAERLALWDTLSSRPSDPVVVAGVVETLTCCGAIAACEEQARALVEGAWARAEPLLPDSHVKTKLRAFGWYVLDRHY